MNESAIYPRPRMKRQAVVFDNRTMDAVTVQNLPPNAAVLIQIRVLTKYFVGPPSDPVRVLTPEGGQSVSHCLVCHSTHDFCRTQVPVSKYRNKMSGEFT